jgi:hypothetical protein
MAALCLCASEANAGTVLLARDSTIRASGNDGAADFELTDGSQDFSGFADAVDTIDAGVFGPRVSANQNSRPSLSDDTGFTGAFAEGSVSAEAAGGPAKTCEAVSNFDLTFQVLGAPSLVSFGGAVGVSGDGTTSVALSNESTGEILLAEELLAGGEDGQSINHSTVLQPGVYELSVAAAVNGDAAGESMAYYAVSLSISALEDDGGGPAPIPLPAAVWSAASVLGAGGLVRGVRRFRRPR